VDHFNGGDERLADEKADRFGSGEEKAAFKLERLKEGKGFFGRRVVCIVLSALLLPGIENFEGGWRIGRGDRFQPDFVLIGEFVKKVALGLKLPAGIGAHFFKGKEVVLVFFQGYTVRVGKKRQPFFRNREQDVFGFERRENKRHYIRQLVASDPFNVGKRIF
jgi:hypothetical protein